MFLLCNVLNVRPVQKIEPRGNKMFYVNWKNAHIIFIVITDCIIDIFKRNSIGNYEFNKSQQNPIISFRATGRIQIEMSITVNVTERRRNKY